MINAQLELIIASTTALVWVLLIIIVLRVLFLCMTHHVKIQIHIHYCKQNETFLSNFLARREDNLNEDDTSSCTLM